MIFYVFFLVSLVQSVPRAPYNFLKNGGVTGLRKYSFHGGVEATDARPLLCKSRSGAGEMKD